MITKGNAILFKCEDCNFSGKTNPALKRHRTMAHGLPKLNLKRARSVYKCNICTLTVDNEEKLKNHKKTQHEKIQRSDSTTASLITSPPKKTPKINESSLKKKTKRILRIVSIKFRMKILFHFRQTLMTLMCVKNLILIKI